MKNKFNLIEKVTVIAEKISKPLIKFSNIPAVAAIQDGLIACMGPILIGSIAMIITILGFPGTLIEDKAVLPFLSPYANQINLIFELTVGLLGLYATFNIAIAYGKRVDVKSSTAGTLALISFILISLDSAAEGMINITSFGLQGLFPGMIIAIVSVKIYKFFIDRNIIIKMPEGVPPAVGQAFASIIPFLTVFVLCWAIRSLIGFNFTNWLGELLLPILKGADNIFAFSTLTTLNNILWSVGLHGGNMLSPIIYPLELSNLTANATAATAGVPLTELPYVWVSGLQYLCVWTAPVWSLLILMITSKVKFFKKFSITCLPAAAFSIVEPVIFGLPLALNPYLIIPFIASTLFSAIFTYAVFALGLVNRIIAALPWATPPIVLGPLATGGDLRVLLVVIINVIIGIIIYLPFFKAYEKSYLLKETNEIPDNAIK